MSWQPITPGSPPNFAQVLTYGGGFYCVAYFNGTEWRNARDLSWWDVGGCGLPTHWQPLPAPPAESVPG